MTEKSKFTSELSRDLSLFHITMMGVGMMIGAGVFLGIGNAIKHSGPGGATLTFALNGIIAIFTAMSYAELSSAIPRAGGAYNFARIGFGRSTSFVAGWIEWFASSVAGSAYAITFAIYILRYISGIGIFSGLAENVVLYEKITGIAIAILFIYINYRGASETGKIGALFTLGQTILLIAIGVIGIIVAVKDPSRLQNFKPFMPNGWHKLFITMGFTYVAFEGFEVIAQAGDETINPKQNLPKAMLYSVFIVTLTYIAVAFATVVAVKAGSPGVDGEVWRWIGSFGARGFGEAIARLMPFANFLLTLGVIFASTSALNATIYSATRSSYALGRDKMLPPFFASISKKRKTPWVALLFTGFIVIFVVLFLDTMDVASSASIMFLFLFFLVNLCVIKIRRNMADELEYGFMMPFFPVLPIIAILCQVILAINLHEVSKTAWIVGPSWIAVGILIYFLYSKSHSVTTEDEILVFEEHEALEQKEHKYKIMVAISNPQNALDLVRNTYRICGAKNAQVEILHMVPVPDQIPLKDADRYMLDGREGIVEIMLYLEPLFPVSTTLRYCRNLARGIVSAVREKKTNMLILGWHGKSAHKEYGLGSTIDPVIERSPCDVVILKDCGNRTFKKVLVPLAGGPNSSFAIEVADILTGGSEQQDRVITAFNVHSEGNRFDIDPFIRNSEKRLNIPEGIIKTKQRKVKNILSAILREAKHHDLVVIGCTLQPVLYQFMKLSLPEMVAERCNKPVVIVKASSGIRSWLKRWI